MDAFRAYLMLVPRSADAHHWTALAALRLGDRRRALAEEDAAIALDPGHATAISLRAGLLLSEDAPTKASRLCATRSGRLQAIRCWRSSSRIS